MKLHELSPAEGSVKASYRKGRGPGSGNGKTAGKGHKGQNARSGGGVRPGFEGGQIPLYRKLPKRGFYNRFATQYAVVNVSSLAKFEDGAVVDFNALMTVVDGNVALNQGTVSAEVVKTGKQKKIMVFKYNAKKNYRRRQGHRQPYTKLVIKSVKA